MNRLPASLLLCALLLLTSLRFSCCLLPLLLHCSCCSRCFHSFVMLFNPVWKELPECGILGIES